LFDFQACKNAGNTMSNKIVCPNCGREYPARPELFGRRVGCKQCGQAFIAEDPSSAPPTEYALGGLLDEVMTESANAEVRAREAAEAAANDPHAPKPKKKKRKKTATSRLTGFLGQESNKAMYALTILGGLGGPTLLALISGSTELGLFAIIVVWATNIAVQLYTMWKFLTTEEGGAIILFWALFCTCGPAFLFLMIYFLITNGDDNQLILLSYLVCFVCAISLAVRFAPMMAH